MQNNLESRMMALACEPERERGGHLPARRACRGSMMMEYVIIVTVMAVAVLFASTWLNDWNGGDDIQSNNNDVRFTYAGAEFQQQPRVGQRGGPDLKGVYQRVQAGIALPVP